MLRNDRFTGSGRTYSAAGPVSNGQAVMMDAITRRRMTPPSGAGPTAEPVGGEPALTRVRVECIATQTIVGLSLTTRPSYITKLDQTRGNGPWRLLDAIASRAPELHAP